MWLVTPTELSFDAASDRVADLEPDSKSSASHALAVLAVLARERLASWASGDRIPPFTAATWEAMHAAPSNSIFALPSGRKEINCHKQLLKLGLLPASTPTPAALRRLAKTQPLFGYTHLAEAAHAAPIPDSLLACLPDDLSFLAESPLTQPLAANNRQPLAASDHLSLDDDSSAELDALINDEPSIVLLSDDEHDATDVVSATGPANGMPPPAKRRRIVFEDSSSED
jgi:hypothetical protein